MPCLPYPRYATDVLFLCISTLSSPSNSVRQISVNICCWIETNIIGNDLFVFYKFPLPSTFLLPPLPYAVPSSLMVYHDKTYTTQNLHVCNAGVWKIVAKYSFQYKMILYKKWIHRFGPPRKWNKKSLPEERLDLFEIKPGNNPYEKHK